MENVAIKKLSIANLYELLESVKKSLSSCKDTQIFISSELFRWLLFRNKQNIVWEEAVVNSFHYCDGLEKAFIFKVRSNNEIKTFQMHFVENCLGYMQLTNFATKGIIYQHYTRGMKTILIITSD